MRQGATSTSAARRSLPTGTVTFLFTDMEGSTRQLAALGGQYATLLEAHNRILRDAIASNGGVVVSTEGDAFFAAFPTAQGAVAAAADAQRSLGREPWPPGAPVRVRMGLHTGEGRLGGDNYVGLDVNRTARIAAVGHGGQVLLSDSTRALVAGDLPPQLSLLDLGSHALKDLPTPERIWQLEVDGLPSRFPPLRTLTARPGNLPSAPTPLLGRDGELRAIAELLETRRLLTLTGPGGTGKTRLALAAAESIRSSFAGGAFLIELQDALDRAGVAAAIAGALGVRETVERELEQGLKEYLREREVLLVLDNFEQVVDAAPLVADLLKASDGLKVIVTSRIALHLAMEQELGVSPLAVPPANAGTSVEALSEYPSVALFLDRARAVRSDFALTAGNVAAVAEICRRLDGLPLAITLAAARSKVLTPAAIVDRLEKRLPVLASAGADLPARQRTLDAAIGWSYELLEPSERALFVRLAVFAGGWTLAAAEAVWNPDGQAALDTLEGLASLADKSLIVPTAEVDLEPRFAMLQVIREFAADRLADEPDARAVHQRHADHFHALAEEVEPELRRSELRHWQRRLRQDADNFRTALRWATEGGDVEAGLLTAGALWEYWHYWAELREGIGWFERLLAQPAARAPGAARAKALRGLAGLVYWQGDPQRAWQLYEEVLAILRDVGDERQVAGALYDSAWAAAALYDGQMADARAREAMAIYRSLGDRAATRLIEAWLLVEPAMLGMGGDPTLAVGAIGQAVEASRERGRAHDAADWLSASALLRLIAGDHHGGMRNGHEALRAWRELGNLGRLPLIFKILAALELALGRPQRAVRLGAAADRFSEELGGDLYNAFGRFADPVAEARSVLDPDEHARAVREGGEMTLDEMVAFALESPTERAPAG